jgi:DNA-binding NtrC family response regulator
MTTRFSASSSKGCWSSTVFRVLTCSNPVRALETYTREKNGIQLVLLDYSMPGLDGGETFQWLRKLNPNIKVILSSGAGDLRLRQIMAKHSLYAYIHKPFRVQEALPTIREVLATSAPRAVSAEPTRLR